MKDANAIKPKAKNIASTVPLIGALRFGFEPGAVFPSVFFCLSDLLEL